MKYFFLLFLFFSFEIVRAQLQTPPVRGKNDTIPVACVFENNQWYPWIVLPEVKISARRIFKDKEARKEYYILRRDVFKVMPIVEEAVLRYKKFERNSAVLTSKRSKRKLKKEFEKNISAYLKKELTQLTIKQGQVFTKLLDREIGMTVYDFLLEQKGRIKVFFYQSAAKIFKQDLTLKYDYQTERDIESILKEYYLRKKRNERRR